MPRFGALAHLDFNHPHLRIFCLSGETHRVEAAIRCPAAEVTAAQFPCQIAAVFPVIRADAAFAGVVGEVAEFGALIQRTNRIGAKRTEAHCRDIEDRGRVRLFALRTADQHAKGVGVAQRCRAHRVTDEFETGLVDIDQRAERLVRRFIFGARIHQRTLGPREGQGVAVGLQQVLADLRADAFDQVTDVAQDRVIAAYRVRGLQQIADTDQAEYAGDQGEWPEPLVVPERNAGEGETYAKHKKSVTTEEGQAHAESWGFMTVYDG